jgi:hypothetical protein
MAGDYSTSINPLATTTIVEAKFKFLNDCILRLETVIKNQEARIKELETLIESNYELD